MVHARHENGTGGCLGSDTPSPPRVMRGGDGACRLALRNAASGAWIHVEQSASGTIGIAIGVAYFQCSHLRCVATGSILDDMRFRKPKEYRGERRT